jgi:hypothetical protein
MTTILVMSGHNNFCRMRNSGGGFLPDKKFFIVGSAYAATRESARSAEVILVEEPRHYTAALKDVREGRFSKSAVVVFDRSPNPELALNKIDTKVQKVHLLYNFPETLAEARAIHADEDEELLNLYMGTFQELSAQVNRLGGLKIRPQAGKKANEWLADYISRTDENDLVLVLSHVEPSQIRMRNPDGDLIPYSDGDYPLVDGTAHKISENGKSKSLVWTLGCDTWDALSNGMLLQEQIGLAITRPIEYHESVGLAERIVRSKGTVRSVIQELQAIDFGKLPRNAPNRDPSPHFTPARPKVPLAVMVENFSGRNIVTMAMIEVA